MVALPLPPNMASLSASDDISKKIRKPYTITKSRESWTEQEHDKFLEALQLFDRDWKKIEAFVGSKTVIQIRSHAQKYFLKVQKNGSGEHVPPPRPKRKAAQPYPQKATKPAPIMPQVSAVTTPVASQTGPAYVYGPQPCTVFVPPVSSSPTVSGWVHHTGPPGNVPFMTKGIPVCTDFGAISMMPGRDCSASSGASSSASWQRKLSSTGQGNQEACLRATPDFAGVYSFIGSVFDPSETGQLKKMKEMAPIDLEAVLLMMRNLSINLSSPDFEEHKRFLSVYDMGSIERMPGVGIGAEDQGIGDDMSVSDQPGSTQLTESADADSHSEPQMQMPFLQSYAQDAAELPRQCQLPYDGGGDISAIAKVSKVFGDVSSSPQVENKPSINLQHKSRRMQQGIILPAGSEASELGVQSGSYRAVEGGNIDMWWP